MIMLYLKEANLEDWQKEYEAIKQMPKMRIVLRMNIMTKRKKNLKTK